MLATGIVTLSALTPQAEAGVTWTFGQVGANVTATASGSFNIGIPSDVGGFGTRDESLPLSAQFGGTFLFIEVGSYYYTALGNTAALDLPNLQADSGVGMFGHSGDILLWDSALGSILAGGTDIAGGGTAPSLTWNNTTLDAIFGVGFFDNGPVTAWTLTGGAPTDTISYDVAAVPEPSSSLLVCLGAFGLLARRKR
jgi:hypothetical protein